MSPDLMRMLSEEHVSRSRPVAVYAAILGFVSAGMILSVMSLPFLVTGLFVGEHVLLFAVIFVGIALICLAISWWVYKGYRWAWGVAPCLTLGLIAFVWWIFQAMPVLASLLLVAVLSAQLILLSNPVRTWIFRSHWIRSHPNEGLMLAAAARPFLPVAPDPPGPE